MNDSILMSHSVLAEIAHQQKCQVCVAQVLSRQDGLFLSSLSCTKTFSIVTQAVMHSADMHHHHIKQHECALQVVDRVRRKAAIFGQDITDSNEQQPSSYKVEPDTVASLYKKWIMPLTKQVQVAYLLERLDSDT